MTRSRVARPAPDFASGMSALAALNTRLAQAIKVLVTAMVVVMLGTMSMQIFLRYAFNVSLSWSEELTIALFTWTVLLMAALGVREGFHVRMSLLIRRLPPGARVRAEQAIHLAAVVVGCYLAWSGWRYFADTRGTVSAAIGYPIGLLYSSGMVSGVLIALFAFEAVLEGRVPADEQE